jgi:ribonuclease P protein subunit RPR2
MAKAKQAKGANVPHKALHSRLSYLYQAATYLSAQEKPSTAPAIPTPPPVPSQPHLQNASNESSHNQAPAEPQPASSQFLTRVLLSDLRTVSMKMQIRLSPGMKHTICKRCDALLQDGSTCVTKIENKSKNGRKPWADVLVRTCGNCGCEKRFPVNVERQPRRPNRVSKATTQVG